MTTTCERHQSWNDKKKIKSVASVCSGEKNNEIFLFPWRVCWSLFNWRSVASPGEWEKVIEIFYLFSARVRLDETKRKKFLIMTFDLIRKKVTFIVRSVVSRKFIDWPWATVEGASLLLSAKLFLTQYFRFAFRFLGNKNKRDQRKIVIWFWYYFVWVLKKLTNFHHQMCTPN